MQQLLFLFFCVLGVDNLVFIQIGRKINQLCRQCIESAGKPLLLSGCE